MCYQTLNHMACPQRRSNGLIMWSLIVSVWRHYSSRDLRAAPLPPPPRRLPHPLSQLAPFLYLQILSHTTRPPPLRLTTSVRSVFPKVLCPSVLLTLFLKQSVTKKADLLHGHQCTRGLHFSFPLSLANRIPFSTKSVIALHQLGRF